MKFKIYEPHKSTLGLDANWVSMLVYILPGILSMMIDALSPFMFLIPIVVFFVEKKSQLVKFHSLQYILMSLFSTVCNLLLVGLGMAGGIAFLIAYYTSIFLTYVLFGLLLFSMYKAFQWRSWRVPVLGKFASKIINEEIEN